MTREEKEQIGIYVLQMARFLADGCYQQEMLLKAAHIIDEALEQESTLDKIRSEIEKYIDKEKLRFGGQFDSGLNLALKIIDKYNAKPEIL